MFYEKIIHIKNEAFKKQIHHFLAVLLSYRSYLDVMLVEFTFHPILCITEYLGQIIQNIHIRRGFCRKSKLLK